MTDLTGLRVLLVEDEGTIAFMIEDMLADLGCELTASAARLDQAHESLAETPPDLAILDVNVAGEPSFELARALSARQIPYVFSTGYGQGGLPRDLEQQVVLNKPFTLADLERALAQRLGR